MKSSLTRGRALRQIAGLPLAALAVGATLSAAQGAVANNQKQYKYQNKPGPKGAKCSGCRFFKAPHGCTIVTGTISPQGWCIAFAPKGK
jgi:hypothetical protein